MAPHARPRTVALNTLTPKANILIRGKLSYSRLAKHIDGDELARDQQLSRTRGLQPIDKPYTTATVCQSEVQFKNPAGVNDPAARTPEEQYVWEHQYLSSNGHDTGWCYRAVNKSRNLPEVYQYNPVTHQYDRVILETNLDRNLDVTLVLRIFKGAMNNNGISLDKVLVNEPIRYFNNADDDLQAFGIVLNKNAETGTAPANDAAPAQPAQPAGAPAAQQNANSFAAPGAAPAPTATPATSPVPPAPGQNMGYTAPAPNPGQVPGNSAFGAVPGAAPAPTTGVTYDPRTDPNRQY